jgi:hypothetical protein
MKSARYAAFVFAMVCGVASLRAEDSRSSCTPKFPSEQGQSTGWLGADVAYSIPQPSGTDVWIFGDTLYGTHRVVKGNVPTMVRNSIGISSCTADGGWQVHYYLRKDKSGKPISFFQPRSTSDWYWAMDGFRAGKDLWITLLCVRADDRPSALGFKTCGTDLARITSPGPDPLAWKVTYFPLVPDGVHAYPSATALVVGGYAEIFALNETGKKPLLVTRIPLRGLNAPKEHVEFLAADGQWQKGFDPARAAPVMTPGSPELSIRFHADLNKWVAIMFEPDGFSSKILLRTATSPTGPWSAGKVIYSVPEMAVSNPDYDKDTFCYAAKEHPEFEHGDLVFTYACNTMSVPKLQSEPGIYFPQTVRMAMPSAF